MIDDIMKTIDNIVDKFKKRIYGKTFFCPVCHIELSYHDVDENGLVVCPVCGVVIELESTYGHSIPVVNDVEVKRAQHKLRIHPVATHLPIGLFPIAMLGSFLLLLASIGSAVNGGEVSLFCRTYLPAISNIVFIMFALATVGSVITYLSGRNDWVKRYGKRPYRLISLKIAFSFIFIGSGAAIVMLHYVIFGPNLEGGLIDFTCGASIAAAAAYYALQGIGMIVMATLGHVGGYLVFGK